MKKQRHDMLSDLVYLVGKLIKFTIEDLIKSSGLKKLNLGPSDTPLWSKISNFFFTKSWQLSKYLKSPKGVGLS